MSQCTARIVGVSIAASIGSVVGLMAGWLLADWARRRR